MLTGNATGSAWIVVVKRSRVVDGVVLAADTPVSVRRGALRARRVVVMVVVAYRAL